MQQGGFEPPKGLPPAGLKPAAFNHFATVAMRAVGFEPTLPPTGQVLNLFPLPLGHARTHKK